MALIRCKKCGAEISSKAAFCHSCGLAVRQQKSNRQEVLMSAAVLGGIVGIFVVMALLVELATSRGWLSSSTSVPESVRTVVVEPAGGAGAVGGAGRDGAEILVAEGDELARIIAEEALFLQGGQAQAIAVRGEQMVITYSAQGGARGRPLREALSEDLRALSEKIFSDARFADLDAVELECPLDLEAGEMDGEQTPPRFRMNRSIAEQINWGNMNNDRFIQLLRDINRYWLSQEKQEEAREGE